MAKTKEAETLERPLEDAEEPTAAEETAGEPGAAAPTAAPETPPSPAEELAAVKDQLLRLAAEFDNFRKRARREREEMRLYATEKVLRDVLPVADNLERALGHAPAKDPVADGVRMVAKQLLDILGTYGVKPYDSLGKPFDPERHEALSQAPAGDAEPGSVLEEIERGYMLHDRLLRPAKVVVAAAPPASAGEG